MTDSLDTSFYCVVTKIWNTVTIFFSFKASQISIAMIVHHYFPGKNKFKASAIWEIHYSYDFSLGSYLQASLQWKPWTFLALEILASMGLQTILELTCGDLPNTRASKMVWFFCGGMISDFLQKSGLIMVRNQGKIQIIPSYFWNNVQFRS